MPDAPGTKPKTVRTVDGRTVFSDVATACVVAGACSVPISIIDFAIMAKVAGVVPSMGVQLKAGVKTLFTNPKNFFFVDTPTTYYSLVYRVCFATYFLTYSTANTTRSYYEAQGAAPEQIAWMCGITSSIVNTGMTVIKDSIILRVLPGKFVGAAASNYVPYLSRFGFAFRDTLTCVAAFTLVPLLRDNLQIRFPEWSPGKCKTIASLMTPCAMQLITTSVHIPSIKYQRMYAPAMKWGGKDGYAAGIAAQMRLDFVSALRLRVFRIFVAFGLGTLMNSDLRLWFIVKTNPNAFG